MEEEGGNFNAMDEKSFELFNSLGLKELTSYPLFMNEIDLDNADNEDIVGLRQMIEQEETAEEIIGDWKKQGNDYFATGQKHSKEGNPSVKIWYLKALKCYTLAYDENKSDDNVLVAVLLSNRAAVNLLLGNFGRVVEDCKKGIELDPSNLKLYFRASKASVSMYKYQQALNFCESGLKINDQSKELIQEKNSVVKKMQEIEKKNKMTKSKNDQILSLRREITSLNIQFGDFLFANLKHFMKDSKIHRDAEGVKWPTIFIYEEYKQIDFIQAFCEDTSFGDHLNIMFPEGEFCEWDLDRSYSVPTIEVYAILNQVPPHDKKKDYGKPRKVRLKHTTTLKTILTHPDYVIPGIPVFYIVSNSRSFKEEFLKEQIDKLSQGY